MRLDQIEQEKFDLLPAPVYLRGFVFAYARAVGFAEPQEAAGLYLERYRQRAGNIWPSLSGCTTRTESGSMVQGPEFLFDKKVENCPDEQIDSKSCRQNCCSKFRKFNRRKN